MAVVVRQVAGTLGLGLRLGDVRGGRVALNEYRSDWGTCAGVEGPLQRVLGKRIAGGGGVHGRVG